MIKPTVGRIVYFTPAAGQPFHESAPLAAIVAHVWSDTCVNLAVFDPNGQAYSESTTSVLLVQPGSPRPTGGGFCEWMPYQLEQQEKHEEVEPDAALWEVASPKDSEASEESAEDLAVIDASFEPESK